MSYEFVDGSYWDESSGDDSFHNVGSYDGYDDLDGDLDSGGYSLGSSFGGDSLEMFKPAAVDDGKPRILLMGLRRSGKSSIQKVVFNKMSPHETLFLEATNKVEKTDLSERSFVRFQIWDFPGQVNFFDTTFDAELIFRGCEALVFVIDAQDDTHEAVTRLFQTIQEAYAVNPKIKFEVFVHKVDGISDEAKIEILHDVQTRIQEELEDHELEVRPGKVELRYHTTSIYDHSIFEAFSKVIQRLLSNLSALESLLDVFITSSRIEKAFLFDVVSKIYIASDTKPMDSTISELCSDMIDVVLDISRIYGSGPGVTTTGGGGAGGGPGAGGGVDDDGSEDDERSPRRRRGVDSMESSGDDPFGRRRGAVAAASSVRSSDSDVGSDSSRGTLCYDEKTYSVIQLNNSTILYLRQINRFLALVCLLQRDAFQKMGLINFNYQIFKKSIGEVFARSYNKLEI